MLEHCGELGLDQPDVLQMEACPPGSAHPGRVKLSELAKVAIAMRPDRIVLGECTGAEVGELLGAELDSVLASVQADSSAFALGAACDACAAKSEPLASHPPAWLDRKGHSCRRGARTPQRRPRTSAHHRRSGPGSMQPANSTSDPSSSWYERGPGGGRASFHRTGAIVCRRIRRAGPSCGRGRCSHERWPRHQAADNSPLARNRFARWLDDSSVDQILIDGVAGVMVVRGGRAESTGEHLPEADLAALARAVAPSGPSRQDDSVWLDLLLPDGYRVGVLPGPLTGRGPLVMIRKPPRSADTLERWLEARGLTQDARGNVAGHSCEQA